jgi:DNA replication protein DnaC
MQIENYEINFYSLIPQCEVFNEQKKEFLEFLKNDFLENLKEKNYNIDSKNQEAVLAVAQFVAEYQGASPQEWQVKNFHALHAKNDFPVYRKAKPPKGLLLKGNNGSGKTLLVKMLAYCLGIPFFNVFELEYQWLQAEGEQWLYTLLNNNKSKAIIIDDLGAESRVKRYGNESFIRMLIDRRAYYWESYCTPTIITTNMLNFKEIEDVYDARTSSRIRGMLKEIKLVGEDRRCLE